MAKETETAKKSSRKSSSAGERTRKTSSGKKGTSRKKSGKKKRRLWIFAVEIIVLLIVLAAFYVVSKLDSIQKPEFEKEEVKVNEEIEEETIEKMTGYTNIALFGLDTRKAGQLGKGNRSDTMIIASINNDTGYVKLVSLYRDTYLNLTNGKYNKCNGAYSAGGPAQAISMINTNLDLDIEYYFSVDFAALTDVVDELGGIEIDVDEDEIEHLNNYIVETSEVTGVETTNLTHTGLQLLDGVQATSYCRIRYTAGDDYKRTERQREVIMEIVSKAKQADLTEINRIIDAVFPKIATNYTHDELVEMAPQMIGYEIIDTAGFPFDKVTAKVKGKGDCVIPDNLAANVKQLHEFLFENYDYVASKEVQNISDQIISDTGYGAEDNGADE